MKSILLHSKLLLLKYRSINWLLYIVLVLLFSYEFLWPWSWGTSVCHSAFVYFDIWYQEILMSHIPHHGVPFPLCSERLGVRFLFLFLFLFFLQVDRIHEESHLSLRLTLWGRFFIWSESFCWNLVFIEYWGISLVEKLHWDLTPSTFSPQVALQDPSHLNVSAVPSIQGFLGTNLSRLNHCYLWEG